METIEHTDAPFALRRGRGVAYCALSWTLVVAWALLIWFVSAHTGAEVDNDLGIVTQLKRALYDLAAPIMGSGVDVSAVGHFFEYFVLGALLVNALASHFDLSAALPLSVALASAYGVLDEFHQFYVPGRSCDPLDWAVDTAAVVIAAALCAFVFRSPNEKSTSK